MTDVFDKKTRTRIMRTVRISDTEPEKKLAAALKGLGVKFRRNDVKVFGKPDFVFRKVRLALFVDGDFWHGRTWFAERAAPATNTDFWIRKFERNRLRDRLVSRKLREAGWSVLRLWGSDVRTDPGASARRVQKRLRRATRLRRAPTSSGRRTTA